MRDPRAVAGDFPSRVVFQIKSRIRRAIKGENQDPDSPGRRAIRREPFAAPLAAIPAGQVVMTNSRACAM